MFVKWLTQTYANELGRPFVLRLFYGSIQTLLVLYPILLLGNVLGGINLFAAAPLWLAVLIPVVWLVVDVIAALLVAFFALLLAAVLLFIRPTRWLLNRIPRWLAIDLFILAVILQVVGYLPMLATTQFATFLFVTYPVVYPHWLTSIGWILLLMLLPTTNMFYPLGHRMWERIASRRKTLHTLKEEFEAEILDPRINLFS